MFSRHFVIPGPAVAAGILSAVISAVFWQGLLTGIIAPAFLPVLPLMVTGFAYGVVGLSGASLVALFVTPLLCGAENGLVVLIFQIFPTWLFTRELLKARLDFERERILWAPPGAAFTSVALYLASFILLIYGIAPDQFVHFLDALNAEWAKAVAAFAEDGATLPGRGVQQMALVLGLWAMVFMLYFTACLANFIVLSFRYSLRPSLRFVPYTPKGFLLVLMGITALFVLIGGPSASDPAAGGVVDACRIACLLLLLPYFASGLGSIHLALSRWQHAMIWQIGFYVTLAISMTAIWPATLWPTLPIVLYGIVRQVSRLTGDPAR